ncbi:hypothetical protein ATN01_00840 [Buchnera aphidicola (Diuraphis noxia)]|uniref:Colicin V production protein n=1 Tax=Buchnera aphidicola subsp. Diuraphis noxia TaxID=118101 RepID=A0A1B2H8H3_BUCDN|nr:hypothetical protein ATN01_00840 [Buchnera aphidicola (Diuraphis noxia)]
MFIIDYIIICIILISFMIGFYRGFHKECITFLFWLFNFYFFNSYHYFISFYKNSLQYTFFKKKF